jgi:hypothetical protein
MKKWVPAAHYRLLCLSLVFGIAVSLIPAHWISIIVAVAGSYWIAAYAAREEVRRLQMPRSWDR